MTNFINEDLINMTLSNAVIISEAGIVRAVLAKSRELKGLDSEDIAILSSISDPELLAELFDTARAIKEAIYGRRLVLFAPLYISNLCKNECLYCAFRAKNRQIRRRGDSENDGIIQE